MVLALGVVAGGCREAEGRSGTPGVGVPPRAVRVAEVERRTMERSIAVTGTLAAREEATLSARVAGRLQRLAVDLGSVVREGEVVAQVEPRDFELRLEQAAAALVQARVALGMEDEGEDDQVDLHGVSSVRQAHAVLAEATSNRDRVRALYDVGIASPSEVDVAEAAFKVASTRHASALEEARTRQAAARQRRAEYEIARKQWADTVVRAPFDGVVQARLASVGEYVAAGTPIVMLVQVDPLRLRLSVPEREAWAVRVGQSVRVGVEGDTNVHEGRIARLSPALVEESRMLLVEADVPREGTLRPGLFARARIVVDPAEQGMSVPAAALLTFAGLEKVFLAEGGKVKERGVVTGRRGAGWVEIVQGVGLGDEVVLDPKGLQDGQGVVVAGGGEGAGGNRSGGMGEGR